MNRKRGHGDRGGGSDPGPLPARWLHCPRKSTLIIADKFLAFKTPLDSSFDGKVAEEYRFHPEMLFASAKAQKHHIGLWIDLTNTSRFYRRELVGCFLLQQPTRAIESIWFANRVKDTVTNIETTIGRQFRWRLRTASTSS